MENAKPTPIKSQTPGHVVVSGRLEAARVLDDNSYMNKIMLPAVDQFSLPSVIEVRSKRRIGNNGEEVTITCHIGGYPRRFRFTDKQTGVQKQGENIVNTLNAIED